MNNPGGSNNNDMSWHTASNNEISFSQQQRKDTRNNTLRLSSGTSINEQA